MIILIPLTILFLWVVIGWLSEPDTICKRCGRKKIEHGFNGDMRCNYCSRRGLE
jgi:hypothetical protein